MLKVEPEREDKRALFRMLREAGAHLIDMSPEPLPEGSELAPLIPGRLRRIRRLDPQRIVLVKANVHDKAFDAIRDAGLRVTQPCRRFSIAFRLSRMAAEVFAPSTPAGAIVRFLRP